MQNTIEILIQDKLKEDISFKVFFMGLAKNTGKTTALNYMRTLLERLTKQTIVLISTGYDGEDLDVLTGLPKPRVQVSRGDLFITTEQLLPKGLNQYKILKRFKFQTPFGEILLIEALARLTITLVSAGNNEHLRQIIAYAKSMIPRPVFLLDGSINRKGFLSLANKEDLLVLSTGAAFSIDLQEQITEIEYLLQLFSITQSVNKSNRRRLEILDQSIAQTMKNQKIVLPNISGVFMTQADYQHFISAKNKLFYEQKTCPLSFITINPFSPYGKPLNQKQYLFSLQKAFPQIPIVDIHQLDHVNTKS